MFPVYGPSAYGDTFGAPARRCLRRLASRRRHLRSARRADPRGRPRHGLLGRLERRRRLPALAARPGRERVLLRAPLRLHDARRQRPAREGGRRARLRGQHGRRGGDAVPPPLRGAPGLDALPGLRRSGQPDEVPRCLEAARGRPDPARRPVLDAGRGRGEQCADTGSDPAPEHRHLDRERPRSRLADPGDERPGDDRRDETARGRAAGAAPGARPQTLITTPIAPRRRARSATGWWNRCRTGRPRSRTRRRRRTSASASGASRGPSPG